MKKALIAVMLASAGIPFAYAATEATATATWKATAKKDSTSALVVTPLHNLAFQYAEGINAFNDVDGLFDVTIKGDASATDFTLKAKQLSGTLTHASMPSTLSVGALWQGKPLNPTSYISLIDTTAGDTGGNLSSLAAGFKEDTKLSTAQDAMQFKVLSATFNGTSAQFDTLPDGLWSGDVKVEFVANWS